MASLTLRDVRKAYEQLEVIHGVDLDIKDGEFVVFVGHLAAANPHYYE